MDELADRIAALEAQIQEEPESRALREDLLSLYVQARLTAAAPRNEHVLWYVRHHPRESFARCPLAHIDRQTAPEAYAAVEAVWRRHYEENPSDALIACGLAQFVAGDDRPRALEILEGFLRRDPTATEVWVDLGRMHPEPQERLKCFQEARARDSKHPNLLVWIAQSAVDVDDRPSAESTSHELLGLVAAARNAHGERLDWLERGQALWAKAREATASEAEARRLVRAISDHAFHKHWAHTALGLVALRNGDLDGAVSHLHQSAAIGGDHRLSSYGPSFELAEALCTRELWSAVADYLEACKAFWNPQILQALQDQIAVHRVPEFPDT